MIIRNFRTEVASDVATVKADVVWETGVRPVFELEYAVPAAFAAIVAPNPDAFLTAALYPARRAGETRVRVEAEVCPLLVRGLETALHWHHHWYGERCPPIAIEAGQRAGVEAKERHGALLFFSGGADCLHTLRRNRVELPPGHPASITHGLMIEGFDMRRGNTYARGLESARRVAATAGGVTLVPVRTNARDLDLDDEFWDREFHGAALASVAHVFSGRFSRALLASGIEIASLFPWASHPLVDPLYSSCDLSLRHDSAEWTRLDKMRMLAEWPAALDDVRVCYRQPQDALNCERCEKCLRTMVELIAVGALAQAGAFAHDDVSADEIRAVSFRLDYHRVRWEEMIPDLERRGRSDLVAAIGEVTQRFRRWHAWKEERDWKGRIKKIDRRWMGGLLARVAAVR